MKELRCATVLLTGATGFLGAHLLRALDRAGVRVVALKRSTSDPWRIADLLDRVAVYDVDTRGVRGAFEGTPIDVVIHAATSYGRGGDAASMVWEANVEFPGELLRTATEFGVGTFFNTDSFSAKHAAPGIPLSDYVGAKVAFREEGARFARASGVKFVNVRLEHVYGPSDNPDKFFPYLLREFLARRPSVALTRLEHRWDVISVDDVVEAYLTLLRHRASIPSDTFEVGWGRTEVLGEVVRLIHRYCDTPTRLDFGARAYDPGTVMSSCADTRALSALGWFPTTTLEAGIARLVAAARDNPASIALRDSAQRS